MKRTIFVFAVVLLFGISSAYAETDTKAAQPGQGHQMMCPKMQQMQGQGMMQGAHQMPMMQQHGQGMEQGGQMSMMCPKMGQMMGHGMMAREMMQMMTDMLKMQQKMIRGLSPVEKKEMTAEIDKMMEKMGKMMSDTRGMMMHGMGGGMMGGMMGGGMAPQPESKKGATEPANESVPKPEHQQHH
jgi:hypothetical protein